MGGLKNMNNNQTLSESESLMAWLDRRIEEVIIFENVGRGIPKR